MRRRLSRTLCTLALPVLMCVPVATSAAHAQAPAFDLVLANGRVIDPETGLDAIRSVGISNGRIEAISGAPLRGRTVLDARGLVVAPGFIDLHAHGQDLPAARMQAFDGVTTALELEAGALPVAAAYERVAREGRPINYGFSASWLFARIAEKEKMEPTGDLTYFQEAQRRTGWQQTLASTDETARIVARLQRGLDEGGLGIGVLSGYAPGHGRKEAFAVAQLAARADVPLFIHVRYNSVIEPQSSFEAVEEVVSLATASRAHIHIHHLNSTSMRDISKIAELVRGAQARGVRITTEAYPYGAGSTVVGAEIFRGNWRARLGGMTAADIELAGVPFSDSTLADAQARTPGAWIVSHYLRPDRNAADQEYLDQSVLFPDGAIASDAMPWTSKGQPITGDVWPLPDDAFAHPRSAGTFTRFLRDYVRERRKVTLIDGLRRMTLIPAQVLEASAPQMKRKGRIQVGADADVIVFDPATVSDRATYTQPNQTAVGMRHVIVNGTMVIRDGVLIRNALPGRAVRRAVTATSSSDGPQAPAKLDAATAARFAALALACVQKEYPNKIAHVLNSAADVKAPHELTPVFYGCYDWHSSVHGHWLLARLIREFPAAPFAAEARAALAANITPAHVAGEVAYLNAAGREAFERPYGLAWLLQLAAELRESTSPDAAAWSAALKPLEAAAVARLEAWVPKLAYPIREGEHAQTAFAFGLILDYARGTHAALADMVVAKVREFHLKDRDCPIDYEPSGQDFLSPCIAEADVVRRVLPPAEFAAWLTTFMPRIPTTSSDAWLPIGVVTDKTDGKLAHLDGLNLSRAWMLEGIASGLPPGDGRRRGLMAAAATHAASGLAAVTGEHYAGGHWLGSFATYLTTGRGVGNRVANTD